MVGVEGKSRPEDVGEPASAEATAGEEGQAEAAAKGELISDCSGGVADVGWFKSVGVDGEAAGWFKFSSDGWLLKSGKGMVEEKLSIGGSGVGGMESELL